MCIVEKTEKVTLANIPPFFRLHLLPYSRRSFSQQNSINKPIPKQTITNQHEAPISPTAGILQTTASKEAGLRRLRTLAVVVLLFLTCSSFVASVADSHKFRGSDGTLKEKIAEPTYAVKQPSVASGRVDSYNRKTLAGEKTKANPVRFDKRKIISAPRGSQLGGYRPGQAGDAIRGGGFRGII